MWGVRFYFDGRVYTTHLMPRVSAIALRQTFELCGTPAVVVPREWINHGTRI